MPFYNVLFVCCLFPTTVLCLTEAEKHDIYDYSEKKVIMIEAHYSWWNEVAAEMISSNQEWPESSDCEVELKPIDIRQLMPALIERVAAIQLNVIAWRCAWYYKDGAKDWNVLFIWSDSNDKYAMECAALADTVSWYNDKFSAKMYIEAYKKNLQKPPESECRPPGAESGHTEDDDSDIKKLSNGNDKENEGEEKHVDHTEKEKLKTDETASTTGSSHEIATEEGGYNGADEDHNSKEVEDEEKKHEAHKKSVHEDKLEHLIQFAQKIDRLLDKIRILNKIFQDANLKYKGVLEKLKKKNENLDEDYLVGEGEEFHNAIGRILWKFLDSDYLEVCSYVLSFFIIDEKKFKDFNEVTESWKEASKQYDLIRDMENHLTKKNSQIIKIIELENFLSLARIKAEKININLEFGIRQWTIADKSSGASDLSLILL